MNENDENRGGDVFETTVEVRQVPVEPAAATPPPFRRTDRAARRAQERHIKTVVRKALAPKARDRKVATDARKRVAA